MWGREISDVCMFWHMFLWRLSVCKAQVKVRTPVKGLSFWLSKKEKLTSKNICIEQQEAVKEDNIIQKYVK